MNEEQELNRVINFCRDALESIEVMEAYPENMDGDRAWATTASTWICPDGAVAYVNLTKINEALQAVKSLTP